MVIPVYNEVGIIQEITRGDQSVGRKKEWIVIGDYVYKIRSVIF